MRKHVITDATLRHKRNDRDRLALWVIETGATVDVAESRRNDVAIQRRRNRRKILFKEREFNNFPRSPSTNDG